MREFERDEYGLMPDDWRWLRWEYEQYDLDCRIRALRALWCKPVVNQHMTNARRDGVICYRDDRGADWALWPALVTTIALILGRYWGQAQEDRQFAKTGTRYSATQDMCFWDSINVPGGYDVMCCSLHPGCRVSIYADGECTM